MLEVASLWTIYTEPIFFWSSPINEELSVKYEKYFNINSVWSQAVKLDVLLPKFGRWNVGIFHWMAIKPWENNECFRAKE